MLSKFQMLCGEGCGVGGVWTFHRFSIQPHCYVIAGTMKAIFHLLLSLVWFFFGAAWCASVAVIVTSPIQSVTNSCNVIARQLLR